MIVIPYPVIYGRTPGGGTGHGAGLQRPGHALQDPPPDPLLSDQLGYSQWYDPSVCLVKPIFLFIDGIEGPMYLTSRGGGFVL